MKLRWKPRFHRECNLLIIAAHSSKSPAEHVRAHRSAGMPRSSQPLPGTGAAVTDATSGPEPPSEIVAGVTRNGMLRAGSHIVNANTADAADYYREAGKCYSRKKCAMTSLTGQWNSRPIAHGVAARTAAQRFLRSLNSLGVIVADSVPTVRDTESANSTAARPAVLDRLR
jgi:hypothetical protein